MRPDFVQFGMIWYICILIAKHELVMKTQNKRGVHDTPHMGVIGTCTMKSRPGKHQ